MKSIKNIDVYYQIKSYLIAKKIDSIRLLNVKRMASDLNIKYGMASSYAKFILKNNLLS